MFQKDHKLELMMAFVIASTSKPSVIYQIKCVKNRTLHDAAVLCTSTGKYAHSGTAVPPGMGRGYLRAAI